MALSCAIVGLPNVGKSTLFSALTRKQAEIANYPFCTIEPNVGLVEVPDKRLYKISELIKTQKVIPTVVKFVDIAGLVEGASKGEGLGNQFLANIRATGIVVHVVRCFEDNDITHVQASVDPLRDIQIIETELCLADMQTVEKRKENALKDKKKLSGSDAIRHTSYLNLLERVYQSLEKGKAVRLMELSQEERQILKDLDLLTLKSTLYVCNVKEQDLDKENEYVTLVERWAETQQAHSLCLCAKLEYELSLLSEEEREEMQQTLGLKESGLDQLIRSGYDLLGLRTYFTAGEKEVRAWTFQEGTKAPQAAGIIHSDFEKGFIRAQVYSVCDLFIYQTEKAVKEAGKLRVEGKEYVVQDGDVVHFLFNV